MSRLLLQSKNDRFLRISVDPLSRQIPFGSVSEMKSIRFPRWHPG